MGGKRKNYRSLFPLTDGEIRQLIAHLKPGKKGCWLWVREGYKAGYGKIGLRGKSWIAHRLIYELVAGPISEGYVVDHLCRTPHCCNPAHLEAVTNAENTRRGRRPRGKKHYHGRKTHCKYGHPFSGDNLSLRYTPDGVKRVCRQCNREWARHYMRQRRAAARETARAGDTAHDPTPAAGRKRAK
jgi:hypothetical protein